MLKNLQAKDCGSPAEQAANLLIYYFQLAIGEDVFRHSGGDMEMEIAAIVENIVNGAVQETMRQITDGQMCQIQAHISDAQTYLDKQVRTENGVGNLCNAVSHLADALNRIVKRIA
jgi:hypothetical protein